MPHQVVVANPAFTESSVGGRASSSDDNRREPPVEQFVGVIEPGFENRRWTTVILGGSKYHDCVSRVQLLLPRVEHDCMRQNGENCSDDYQRKEDPENADRARRGRGAHPCAKNSEISCAGIAPSRNTLQRASSSVRSMMVDATSRGDEPPSTIMGIRTPSCSRTASAVVHSLSPLRFAEVAVMGIRAACTTARGMAEFGTRKATLPVLAVTLSGRREAAFTIMVSGPGQNFFASALNSSGRGLASSSAWSTSSISSESGLCRDRDLIS